MILPRKTRTKPTPDQHPCACSTIRRRTGPKLECDAMTYRIFAQGHDARLMAYLMQGEREGATFIFRVDGRRATSTSASEAANSIAPRLGAKIAEYQAAHNEN